jgi:hypothetical protein
MPKKAEHVVTVHRSMIASYRRPGDGMIPIPKGAEHVVTDPRSTLMFLGPPERILGEWALQAVGVSFPASARRSPTRRPVKGQRGKRKSERKG